MAREMSLTNSDKVFLVDDADYDLLSQFKWFLNDRGYVIGSMGGKAPIALQRFLCPTEPGMQVDHADLNPLNNQRSNLRPATPRQNTWNRGVRRDSTSGFKGVRWLKKVSLWRATMVREGKHINLGYYEDKVEAARQYNMWAAAHYGEFAYLNVIPGEGEEYYENLRKLTVADLKPIPKHRRIRSDNKSGYKGVQQISKKSWLAKINFDGKLMELGYYSSPEDAAKAYNDRARELFGDYAKLNKIPC